MRDRGRSGGRHRCLRRGRVGAAAGADPVATIVYNATQSPVYLDVDNFVNLFRLSIEKVIIAVAMTFVIINGEIDLSVASVMAFSACAWPSPTTPACRSGWP